MGVLEKLILDTTPALALTVGILVVVHRLCALYIKLYFDKMVPVYSRGVVAIEKLALSAESVAEELREDHKLMSAGLRGVNWEIKRWKEAHGQPDQL